MREVGKPMECPVCDRKVFPRQAEGLKVADAYLQDVLDGRRFLLFDGAMGTMLQRAGLTLAGELPELLNATEPAAITAIHRAYVEAGSQVVTANTFGANRLKLAGALTVPEAYRAAVECARAAGPRYVAADIGPTGSLLEPLGPLDFDGAYDLFAEQARAAEEAGADLIIIETMTDIVEMKAAVLACKEQSRLPIFATMTFGEDGRTFLGTAPSAAARLLDGLGVDALGINCSLGPHQMIPLIGQVLDVTAKPVVLQANAGLPMLVDGRSTYGLSPEEYVRDVRCCIEAGVTVVGGCCGTDPSFIAALASLLDSLEPAAHGAPQPFAVTSPQHEVLLGPDDTALVGERINPAGKPRLQEALRRGDLGYLAAEAAAQAAAGADILDVNVALPDVDEPALLAAATVSLEGVCPLPLQIDSPDPRAIEAAVRVYGGIPLVNSVNASEESMEAILPILSHYGCAAVGLTLDEGGIPSRAEDRLALARRLADRASQAGIPAHRLAIDCLVMAASSNQDEARETLKALRAVKGELGLPTVLGVSNISFGLPGRSILNATYLSAALEAGLNLPIMNPLDDACRGALQAWRIFSGQDARATAYIAAQAGEGGPLESPHSNSDAPEVYDAVLAGLKDAARDGVQRALAEGCDPLEVMNDRIIPALDEVGRRFEEGSFFLPQLMASAEAAKAGFDCIRDASDPSQAASTRSCGPIVLATVKGDIHDIGKNIVAMLLANYGYEVIDLGRDVDPQAVVDAVERHAAAAVGLSALMTTTLGAMEQTIGLLRQSGCDLPVFVGGAVLDERYAAMVGADFYAKDAAEAVRIAGGLPSRS